MYYGVYQEDCMILIFSRVARILIDMCVTVCILIMDETLNVFHQQYVW